MKPGVLWLAVPVLLATGSAGAEIFKCKTKDGVDLYQNFPCALDSLGSLPSANRKPAGAGPTTADPVAAKPHAGGSPNAAAPQVASASEPRAGMTPDEVRAIWGEPDQIVQDEPPSGREEVWEYGDGRSVRFNAHKQRVSSVQR